MKKTSFMLLATSFLTLFASSAFAALTINIVNHADGSSWMQTGSFVADVYAMVTGAVGITTSDEKLRTVTGGIQLIGEGTFSPWTTPYSGSVNCYTAPFNGGSISQQTIDLSPDGKLLGHGDLTSITGTGIFYAHTATAGGEVGLGPYWVPGLGFKLASFQVNNCAPGDQIKFLLSGAAMAMYTFTIDGVAKNGHLTSGYPLVSAGPGLFSMDMVSRWNTDGSGYWSQGNNWDGGVPVYDCDVILGSGGLKSGPGTVILDTTPPPANCLYFNNANSYTIADNGHGEKLTLKDYEYSGNGLIHVASGSHFISAGVSLGYNTYVSGGGSLSISGQIDGAGGVTKTGSGSLALSGANTYTGNTTIDGGKLTVNNTTGSGTGAGMVTVNSGGKLSGSGIIGGTVLVNSGGILDPGDGPGILTVNNSVTFQAGSTLSIDMKDLQAGSGYNQLKVTAGSASLGGLLSLSFESFIPTGNDFLFIINNAGTGSTTGAFQFSDNSKIGNFNGCDWYITYDANNSDIPSLDGGNDVAIYSVPEPSTLALLLTATLGGLLLRRP